MLQSKMPRQALLLSSGACHGYELFEFCKQEMIDFLESNNIKEIVFVPYALKDYDGYTKKIKDVIEKWGYSVTGIHEHENPVDAINSAKAVYIGGGNTFLLLKRLYENNLVTLIHNRVYNGDLVYIGSSAGTNVATKSIHTTNDMPIIYPPSFDAIALVPFNINPHYIETPEGAEHKGETRDQRIQEFLQMPYAGPVLGLKEGSMLHVNDDKAIIKGVAGAVLFEPGTAKVELEAGTDVSYLLEK